MNNLTRRQFIKTSGYSLLGAAVLMNSGTKAFASPSATPFSPVRFAVISDPHLDIKGSNGMRMGASSVECLRNTVIDLNKEKNLGFVMINGDILLDGEVENAEVARKELTKLTAPTFVISGNHDYKPANPEKLRDGFSYLPSEGFRNFFAGFGYEKDGDRYYAKQIVPGLRLLALDACLPLEMKKWGGELSEEQLDWLDKQLSAHSDQVNLVFMHHNFIPWSVDELPGGPKQWFCIDNAAEVRAVLAKNSKSTPIALSGHRHIGLRARELNGINYFALPSLNSHPMRYSVFNVSHEQITWKTPMVTLDEKTHIEARNGLLNAKWWRAEQYQKPSSFNDIAVLRYYENNDDIVGQLPLMKS